MERERGEGGRIRGRIRKRQNQLEVGDCGRVIMTVGEEEKSIRMKEREAEEEREREEEGETEGEREEERETVMSIEGQRDRVRG